MQSTGSGILMENFAADQPTRHNEAQQSDERQLFEQQPLLVDNDSSQRPPGTSIRRKFQSHASIALSQSWKQAKQEKLSYCLGFCACFVVVVVFSVLSTTISQAPVVFLKLAEAESGQVDVIWQSSDNHRTVNFTRFMEILGESTRFSSPRYRDLATVYRLSCDAVTSRNGSLESCYSGDDDSYNTSACHWLYGNATEQCQYQYDACLKFYCPSGSSSAMMFLIDPVLEKRMQLGRGWKGDALNDDEAIVQSDLASRLNISEGDRILVRLDAQDVFRDLWSSLLIASGERRFIHGTSAPNTHVFFVPYTVSRIIDDGSGKYGDDERNVVILSYDGFLRQAARFLTPLLSENMRLQLYDANLYEHALLVYDNFPPDVRIETYLDPDVDAIEMKLSQFASNAAFLLGFPSLSTDLPIAGQLKNRWAYSLFLGLILDIITYVLLLLSIMLIYSLLSINVQMRSFEMGVLRLLGARRSGLVAILLSQGFSFTLPAWITGLIVAQCVQLVIGILFNYLTGVATNSSLTGTAIFEATLLVFSIPLLASIFPILSALRSNVHDALDTRRSKASAVKISIERSETGRISVPMLLGGALCAFFGFVIYYLFPYSLLALQLELLLNIFVGLLLGMILGLVVLGLNVVLLLQRTFAYIFLFFERTAVRTLLSKNFVAHKLRNRRTTVMFALSVGFIVFVSVAYSIEVNEIAYRSLQRAGASISVEATGFNRDLDRPNAFEPQHLSAFESALLANPFVEQFSWVSLELGSLTGQGSSEVCNVGRTKCKAVRVYGVSPHFFHVAYNQFVNIFASVNGTQSNQPLLAEQLYRKPMTAIMGSAFHSLIAVDLQQTFLLQIDAGKTANHSALRFLSPVAFMDGVPSFSMSQFPNNFRGQDMLVSLPTLVDLLLGYLGSVEQIPMYKLLVKMKSTPSATEVGAKLVQKSLKDIAYDTDTHIEFKEESRTQQRMESSTKIVYGFFGFATVIAMTISFFSLFASTYVNIHEQSKEIGVLRSIGFSRISLSRVYIYEAFFTVFTACLIGLAIGITVAYTMLQQQAVLSQLPLPFEFPYVIFATIVVLAIILALGASTWPLWRLLRNSAVDIMRK